MRYNGCTENEKRLKKDCNDKVLHCECRDFS